MVMNKRLKCFVCPVFTDEVARRFRYHTIHSQHGRQANVKRVESYKMKQIWNIEGPACSRDGILHAQSFLMLCVANDMPAATSAPTKYNALKREVMMGRSFGYASSPINEEPAMIQNGMPNPRNHRAMTYIAAEKKLAPSPHTGCRILTAVGEALQKSAEYHHPRPDEDSPSTAIVVVQHRHERESADSAQVVRG